jgi:hypothetical protein
MRRKTTNPFKNFTDAELSQLDKALKLRIGDTFWTYEHVKECEAIRSLLWAEQERRLDIKLQKLEQRRMAS